MSKKREPNYTLQLVDRWPINDALISIKNREENLKGFIPGLMKICPKIKIHAPIETLQAIDEILEHRYPANLVLIRHSLYQHYLRHADKINLVIVDPYPLEVLEGRPEVHLPNFQRIFDKDSLLVLTEAILEFPKKMVMTQELSPSYGALLQELTENQGRTLAESRIEAFMDNLQKLAGYYKFGAKYINSASLEDLEKQCLIHRVIR